MDGDQKFLLASLAVLFIAALVTLSFAQGIGTGLNLDVTNSNSTLLASSFTETGLPSGANWNVTFDSTVNSSTSNTIGFVTSQGNFTFTIPDQAVNGTTYVPDISEGYAVAGNSTPISFAPVVSTSTTVSTATSTASTTVPQLAAQSAKIFNMSSADGKAKGTFLLSSSRVRINMDRSVLKSLSLNLRTSGIRVNVSVTNSTQIPTAYSSPSRSVYQFIQINGSLSTNPRVDIDPFLANVTYNFTVPISWVQRQGGNVSSIMLLKYAPSTGEWTPLQTSLTGSNTTAYFYSTTSNSLSTYAVIYSSLIIVLSTGTPIPTPNVTTLSAASLASTSFLNGTVRVSGVYTTYAHPKVLGGQIGATTYINITSSFPYPIFISSTFFKAVNADPNMSSIRIYELYNQTQIRLKNYTTSLGPSIALPTVVKAPVWVDVGTRPILIQQGVNQFKITGKINPNTFYEWSFAFSTAYLTSPSLLVNGTQLSANLLRYTNASTLGALGLPDVIAANALYSYGNLAINAQLAGNYNTLRVSRFPIATISIDPVWDGSTQCSNNWAGGACQGLITYTANTVLTNDVNTSNSITINSGVVLTTNGYSIYIRGTFSNSGTVSTGVQSNGGAGGQGVQSGYPGGSNANSYAGSGGGGAGVGSADVCTDSYDAGGPGGSTLAAGGTECNPQSFGGSCSSHPATNGLTPGPPTMNNANMIAWFNGGFTNYLGGAGGGGGGGVMSGPSCMTRKGGGSGGGGGYGVYIQANTLSAGVINANGVSGSNATRQSGAGGGGGGGGFIMLVYGSGGYTAGTYNVLYGNGGTSDAAGGGNGNYIAWQYTTPPINTVPNAELNLILYPNPARVSNSIIYPIPNYRYTTLNTIVGHGVAPYTGNWVWTAPNSIAATSPKNTIVANILNGGLLNSVLTVNAYATQNIIFTFNGVNYAVNMLGTNTIYGKWSLTGNYQDSNSPPWNVILSATTFNIVPYTPLAVTISAPSNAVVDVGQNETFTATVTGGIGPFNGIYKVVNSVTVGTITHTQTYNSFTSPNSFTFQVVSADTSNAPEKANVIVWDSNTIQGTANSVYSSTFKVYPQLSSTAFYSSNSQLPPGNYQVLTANIIGGNALYTYYFTVFNAGQSVVTNTIYAGQSAQTKTFTYRQSPAWGIGAFTATVYILDSASTNMIASNTLTYTVNGPAPQTATVGFTTGNTAIIGASSCSLTLSSGFPTYFWSAGFYNGGTAVKVASGSGNWINDTNMTTYWASGTYGYNVISIGHNSVPTGKFSSSSTAISRFIALTGIGANVVFANGQVYAANVGNANSLALPYTVSTSNSFVILMYASAGKYLSFSTSAPGNIVSVNSNTTATQSAIITINSLSYGTYNAVATTPTASSIAIVAYVFPPYPVNMLITPAGAVSGANIVMGGAIYTNGMAVNVIGSNTITASAPSGYKFNNWIASNTANIIIANTLANPTYLTVEGAGSLTANFVTSSLVTPPSNIVEYIPINLLNTQSTAFPANAQIMIPFNALAYQQYETKSLNNTEFFWANGTLISSWLEGNMLNELRNANVLYQSANVLFLVRLYNSNLFLPANTGSAVPNTIYLGFAGNVPSTANMLWTSTTTGVAPQLANTIPSITYAQYDNGAQVFPYYQAWGGLSALPSGWSSVSGTSNTYNPTYTKIVSSSSSAGSYGIYETPQSSMTTFPTIFEFYGTIPPLTYGATPNFVYDFSSAGLDAGGFTGNYEIQCLITSLSSIDNFDSYCTEIGNTISYSYNGYVYSNQVLSLYISSSTAIAEYSNYVQEISATGTATTPKYFGFRLPTVIYNGNTYANNAIVFWLRTRTYPPNGAMPTITFLTPVAVSTPSTTTLTATPNPYTLTSNSLTIGQSSTGNTVISNGYSGTTSYTGNVFIYPPASSNIANGNTINWALPVSNNALTFTVNAYAANSLSLTANSVIYWFNAIGTNTIYGTWTFNDFADDANGDANPNPVPTNTITISSSIYSCYITENVVSMNFGSASSSAVPPGTTSSYNSILYSDAAGNVNTYLWVATTNWIYTSNSNFGFLYTNTLWSVNSGSGYAAMLNALPGTNTLLLIPFGSSNTLYYKVSIPNAQTAASYNSIITGQITC